MIRRTDSVASCLLIHLQAAGSVRVSNINTIKRGLFTLALLLLVVQAASAQTVLNFPRAVSDGPQDTGVAIMNPNPYFADVQLTLYGFDGNPIANGLVNPVNYRIAPKSQIQMSVSQMFLSGKVEGWIQASSASNGLTGFYFNGDYAETLEGDEAASEYLNQVIPMVRETQTTHTDLMIANPTALPANVTITFNNAKGDRAGTSSLNLPAHGASRTRATFADASTALINSSAPVLALGILSQTDSLMFVNGQRVDQAATTRVIPHFLSGNGFDSELILSNPAGAPVSATVTLHTQSGTLTQPATLPVTIPARGSVSLTAASITGRIISPLVDGWVQVDSPNQVLNGLLKLDSGRNLSAIPMQSVAMDRLIFSQSVEDNDFYTELDLVNSSATGAGVEISLLHMDGTLVSRRSETVNARSKFSKLIRDIFPESLGQGGGFISIRSSAGIYGVEMLSAANLRFVATVVPQRLNQDFTPTPNRNLPKITRSEPDTVIGPGDTLRLAISEISVDTQVLIGSFTLTPRFPLPGLNVLTVEVPAVEPGFVNVRVRVHGIESEPLTMQVLSGDNTALATVGGQAFYQKIEVNDAGLDLSRPSMVPIRSARVEVVDAATQSLISVSETDGLGRFTIAVPPQSPVKVRVISRLRSTALRVVDNTNNNVPYVIETDFDARENPRPLLADRTRVSGAFNILEMIQRSNDLVQIADPGVIPPAPAIFWSVRNSRATIGTTVFNVTSNTAKILGERGDDSDEFDDAVIIHEYAHMLAARFSRDDSPGDAHHIGDILDPRLAWSEGWANFFSSAARNDAVYRDSGNNRVSVRIDLEDNQPPNDIPGYWSEASIGSLLWDLFDGSGDPGDTVQYPIGMIWSAFTDLRRDSWVYLPSFLDRFLSRYPAEADTLRGMVQLRSIDFQPNVRPSVTNPWPTLMAIGSSVQGDVDSLTKRRTNLSTSAHFYAFTTTGASLAIRLDIIGPGDGGNSNSNDLDLFLLDVNGRVIDSSDRGLNGQSELITRRVPAGTYVIEVRSYYVKAETNERVYNSARYRLGLTAQ